MSLAARSSPAALWRSPPESPAAPAGGRKRRRGGCLRQNGRHFVPDMFSRGPGRSSESKEHMRNAVWPTRSRLDYYKLGQAVWWQCGTHTIMPGPTPPMALPQATRQNHALDGGPSINPRLFDGGRRAPGRGTAAWRPPQLLSAGIDTAVRIIGKASAISSTASAACSMSLVSLLPHTNGYDIKQSPSAVSASGKEWAAIR